MSVDGSADGFFRRQFARPAAAAQEIEQRGIALRKAGPCFRPARVDDRVAADEFAGQAEGAGGNLAAPAVCVVNPSRLAAAMPEGKTLLRREASFWIAAGFGRLLPKAVCRVR